MRPLRVFAATGDAVARVTVGQKGEIEAKVSLEGSGAQCVAVDPHDPERVFVGTFDRGIYRSVDGGDSWGEAGESLPHNRVMAVAISPSQRVGGRSVVYAGTEPSELYASEDDGRTWRSFPRLSELPSAPNWSFPPRPWTSHVRWIAPHDTDPALLFVGIELGGVMRSTDGGETWEDRKPDAYRDCHALATHALAPERVYEAAGEGVALSADRGSSWRAVDEGMDRHYTWALTVDSRDPDLWYVSAAPGPGAAHRRNGNAQAVIYRKRGDRPWEGLGGSDGLERPLSEMPYALLAPRDRPDALVGGLASGELLLSENAGESWRSLDVRLPAIRALSEAAG